MDELLQAATRIALTANRFRALFQASEVATRYSLINPWLRALGWDVEDPSQVHPEFRIEPGRADYGLFAPGEDAGLPTRPTILVEA